MSLLFLQVAGTLALFGNGILQSQTWEQVNIFTDVTYKEIAGESLKLDLYLPADSSVARPTVLCIHGGAWVVGSKEDWASLCKRLAQSGYVAASMDYRKLPGWPYPAGLADARDAVRYLKENAQVLGVDPGRIAVLGSSAGGQLAGLIAYAPEMEGVDDPEASPTTPEVQAAVLLYAATDLVDWSRLNVEFMSLYLGASFEENPSLYIEASPSAHVDASDPPTLLVHGTMDAVVPISQSVNLWQSLRDAGVPAIFLPRVLKDHGFVKTGPRDKEWFTQVVLTFLERYL